jgi:hypothetical protein
MNDNEIIETDSTESTVQPIKVKSSREPSGLLLIGTWMIALSLVLLAIYIGMRVQTTRAATDILNPVFPPTQAPNPSLEASPGNNVLPEYLNSFTVGGITRRTSLHTNIPNRPRTNVIEYTVAVGDSVFGIAQSFTLKPETILWANYDQLNDSPDMLTPGMKLNIPPVNGVYYQLQEGDTLDTVAGKFKAKMQDILGWEGNNFDLTHPQVESGQWLMIPNGQREFRQWLVPTIARAHSGVSKTVLGPGACEGDYSGAYGSGVFIWPSANHVLSGNDFWSGHLGIDIAGALGDGVFASDSGVVVFAGWSYGGYGNMVMIDHGNGYQTVYAHLSSVSSSCGQSVSSGSYIGAIGSTGNSTGTHLHFEVRSMGGFISPWYVLPAP